MPSDVYILYGFLLAESMARRLSVALFPEGQPLESYKTFVSGQHHPNGNPLYKRFQGNVFCRLQFPFFHTHHFLQVLLISGQCPLVRDPS